jgi:hypothetical protein
MRVLPPACIRLPQLRLWPFRLRPPRGGSTIIRPARLS